MVPRAIGHHGSTMTTSLTTLRGGFTLTLQLDRADLLPDRLVGGIVRLVASDAREIRGARVTLVGTETWRYDQNRARPRRAASNRAGPRRAGRR